MMGWRFDGARLTDFDPVPAGVAEWLEAVTAEDQFAHETIRELRLWCPRCDGEPWDTRSGHPYGAQCPSCSAKVPWEEFERKQEVEKTYRDAWRGEAEGLLIVGPIGCGKTHLAAALRHDLIRAGFKTMWRAAQELAWESRGAIGTDAPDPYHDAAMFHGVLILDDVGAVKYHTQAGEPTHAHDGIAHVLRLRYDYLRPTILTAHQSLSRLAEDVGLAIASRLLAMTHVELTGEDRRATERQPAGAATP